MSFLDTQQDGLRGPDIPIFFCLNVLRICTRGSIFYFLSCLRAGMDGPLQGGDVPKFLVVQAGLWLQ